MTAVGFWLRAARAPFLPASLLSVALGAAVAHRRGMVLHWPSLALTALGIAAVHLAVNLINDYYDARVTDRVNQYRSPFNAGSGVIQSGQASRSTVGAVGLVLLLVGLVCGIVLAAWRGPLVWGLMILGAVLGVGYSAPPLGLMGTGWGELVAGAACGPLVAVGAAYVQRLPGGGWSALWPSVPAGLLVSAILVVNEIPDFAADRIAGKRNLIVRFGPAAGAKLHGSLLACAFAWIMVSAALGVLPATAWLTLIASPLAISVARRSRSHAGQPPGPGLVQASAGTVLLHLAVSAILVLSYLV